jgi:hypothetical protein
MNDCLSGTLDPPTQEGDEIREIATARMIMRVNPVTILNLKLEYVFGLIEIG